MSHKRTTEEQQDELSWEDAVARYLEDNPGFLDSHPQLLARLSLNHHVEGRAVSLIERQVQVLREQHLALQQQLRELVSIARENDVLGNRLHRFALAMLDGGSLDTVLDNATDLLRHEFKLDCVKILMRGDRAKTDRPEIVAPEDRRLTALLGQFQGGKPVCGARHDESLLQYLFADFAADVRSCALIPLGHTAPRGVLCLGSHDPHRFHPGMGTVYLSRLGELLLHGLEQHGL